MKVTFTGAASLLEMERSDWVGWPLISLTPNISEEGKEAEIDTAMFGVVEGFSNSSSTTYLKRSVSRKRRFKVREVTSSAATLRALRESNDKARALMSTIMKGVSVRSWR